MSAEGPNQNQEPLNELGLSRRDTGILTELDENDPEQVIRFEHIKKTMIGKLFELSSKCEGLPSFKETRDDRGEFHALATFVRNRLTDLADGCRTLGEDELADSFYHMSIVASIGRRDIEEIKSWLEDGRIRNEALKVKIERELDSVEQQVKKESGTDYGVLLATIEHYRPQLEAYLAKEG